jgi:glycosyltransferase involved in cell wall biosynthesis
MRILQITAGAAGMYCGSCLRDNALAAELLRQGHEVTLVPLYTPTLTDETNVSFHKVFFGGISVYLEQHSALFRHTPWLVDKLWDSSFALKAAAHSSIPTNPQFLGKMTVSMIRGEDGRQRKEVGKLVQWLRTQPPPDLVVLPNSMLIGLADPIRRALGVPVCCTLQGEDLFLEGLDEPYRSESLALIRAHAGAVSLFLPTSDYYADFMADYLRIPRERLQVVRLGINIEGYEPRAGSSPQGTSVPPAFTIGYFARVAPEKGLHILAEAYRELRNCVPGLRCRLEAAGYIAPEHKVYLAGIERQFAEWGLAAEFRYHGAVDRAGKIAFLQSIDVLSAPGHYADPKGIYVLEGMACGVPFVQPNHGAFPELKQRTHGGLLVNPGDPKSVASALAMLGENRGLLETLGRNAYDGVRKHHTVRHMAESAVEAYSRAVRGTEPVVRPCSAQC